MTRWQQSVQKTYPDLLQRTYFLPSPPVSQIPAHAVRVAGPHTDNKTQPPVSKFSLAAGLQESDVRDDATQERVLRCLQDVAAEAQNEVMFVISHLSYADYLSDPAHAAAASALPRPVDLKSENKHRGDFDVLILHRECGIFVGEIKTVGDMLCSLTEEEKDQKVAERVRQAAKQLQKADLILRHLVSDQQSPPRIRKTLMLPNVTRVKLRSVLTRDPQLSQDLCHCLGVTTATDPSLLCLTSDDLHNPGPWWQQWVKRDGPDPAMTDDVYLDLVSRFCGPATTSAKRSSSPSCRPSSAIHLHLRRHSPSERAEKTTHRWASPYRSGFYQTSLFKPAAWLRSEPRHQHDHEPHQWRDSPTSDDHLRGQRSLLQSPFLLGQRHGCTEVVYHREVRDTMEEERILRDLHIDGAGRPTSGLRAQRNREVFGLTGHHDDIHHAHLDPRDSLTQSAEHPTKRRSAYLSAVRLKASPRHCFCESASSLQLDAKATPFVPASLRKKQHFDALRGKYRGTTDVAADNMAAAGPDEALVPDRCMTANDMERIGLRLNEAALAIQQEAIQREAILAEQKAFLAQREAIQRAAIQQKAFLAQREAIQQTILAMQEAFLPLQKVILEPSKDNSERVTKSPSGTEKCPSSTFQPKGAPPGQVQCSAPLTSYLEFEGTPCEPVWPSGKAL